MAKIVDENGFWLIKNNPVSKEGVYPYLGETISPDLEPKKIYYVYRPAEELENEEAVESFNAVPLSDEHDMLGEDFKPYDEKPASGVLFNTYAKDGKLYGDIKIYSEKMKEEIQNGKKELSLGYMCEYDIQSGEWNGQKYDAIQKNLRGNHIALVDRGRMGSDVRVYDRAITMDKMDVVFDEQEIPQGSGSPEENRADKDSSTTDGVNTMSKITMDTIKEILAIATTQVAEDEMVGKIAKVLEKSNVSIAKDEDVEEEKKDTEDECGTAKDEAEEEKKETEDESEEEKKETEDEDEEKKETEDEDDEEKKETEDEDDKEDDKKTSEDSMASILSEIDRRNALVKELEPHIGHFACDGWTAQQVAEYGCKELDLQAKPQEAESVLRGFLAGKAKNEKVYGLDSMPEQQGIDKSIQNYLK